MSTRKHAQADQHEDLLFEDSSMAFNCSIAVTLNRVLVLGMQFGRSPGEFGNHGASQLEANSCYQVARRGASPSDLMIQRGSRDGVEAGLPIPFDAGRAVQNVISSKQISRGL